MPRIIPYPTVLETLAQQNLKPLYYNSGTFGFIDDATTQYAGWIGADDPTLRPTARAVARTVAAPYPQTLARMTRTLWETRLSGDLWFTPGSHWAFELEDGGAHFMPALLRSININPDPLRQVNQAPAIAFNQSESDLLESFLVTVFQNAKFTDYGVIFPNYPVVGLLHHHVQLWWRTMSDDYLTHLNTIPA